MYLYNFFNREVEINMILLNSLELSYEEFIVPTMADTGLYVLMLNSGQILFCLELQGNHKPLHNENS